LLRDILLDLPTTLYARARAHDSDDYDAQKGKLAVDVQVMPNTRVYAKYLPQLQARLKKVSLMSDETSVDASPADLTLKLPRPQVKGYRMNAGKELTKLRGPDLSKHQDAWCLWVLDPSSRPDQTRWTAHVVDADPGKVLRAVHGELSVKVELLDSGGEKIAGEEFSLAEDRNGSGWLGSVAARLHDGGMFRYGHGVLLRGAGVARITAKASFNAYVGPMLFDQFTLHVWNKQYTPTYAVQRTYRRHYSITKDQFKNLKTIRCTLVFKKTTPKE
jgi:hypothetical protein